MNALWNDIAGGTLTDAQLGQLDAYLDALIEKNKQLNLTRITDRAEAEIKHVADALTLLPFIDISLSKADPKHDHLGWNLADVGTGGGIPGAILAIARPQVQVTLIDATRKKLDAVRQMCDAVGVKNVRTLHARVETLDERFDWVVSRAVADVRTLLEWCLPVMHAGTWFLALKGPKAAHEVQEAQKLIKRHDLRAAIERLPYPGLEGHAIVIMMKDHRPKSER
jgi:16S rRNA (guanine527-N7)-methyltransferase